MAADGRVSGRGFEWPAGSVTLAGGDRDVIVGIRPEALRLRASPDAVRLGARVVSVLPAGSYTVIQAETEGGERLYVQVNDEVDLADDTSLTLYIDPE
ncbi:MAG: TOBE domain-containing protein, partial [Trueperaceae bacterium]